MSENEPAGLGTHEQVALEHLERGRAASVEQRLDWLEGMLELARQSGALAREVDRRRRERGLVPLAEVVVTGERFPGAS